MINLSNPALFLKAKKQDKPAALEVTSIVVLKKDAAQLAAITKAIAEAGFKVDVVKELDGGAVMFAQVAGDPEDGAEAIRMSGDTVVTVKGFDVKKAAAFAKLMKAEDFYPGLDLASKYIEHAVKAGESTDGYSDYVEALKGVPAAAYKLDSLVAAAMKKAKPAEGSAAEEAQETPEEEAAEDKAKKASPAKKADPAKKAMACPDGMDQDKWDAMSEDDQNAYMAKAAKGDAPKFDLATVIKQSTDAAVTAVKADVEPKLAALEATIKNLTLALEGVVKSQKESAKKMEVVDKALGGTVLAAPGGEDQPSTDTAWKNESDGKVDWITDTALQSRTRKYNKQAN